MSLDENTLREVAHNGEMDWTKWPSLIEPLLERLNQIVYHEFSIPRPYPVVESLHTQPQHTLGSTPSHNQSIVQISQTPTTPHALPPVPAFPGSSAAETTTSHIPNSQPDHTRPSLNDQFNPEIPIIVLQQLNGIVATLRASFYTRPPHTIQRLSELTLEPQRHYKTLPAWLRAVDRVVSVSSTADIFPLTDTPTTVNGINGDGAGGILWNNGDQPRNGIDGKDKDGGLGSDESLGGALLTPIPWLREVESNTTNETNSMNGDLEGTVGVSETLTDDFLGEEIQLPASDFAASLSTAVPSTLTDAKSTSPSNNENPTVPSQPPLPPLTLSSHSSDPLVPDRPLGAVTQGELIRMEQEAGVIPVSHSATTPSLPRTGRTEHAPSITLGVGVGLDDPRSTGGNGGEEDEMYDSKATPHARGPHVVGTVDMGLIGGKGVEVTLGPDEMSKTKKPDVNVHDAQNVLAGGHGAKSRKENNSSDNNQELNSNDTTTPNNEEDYIDVAKQLQPSSHPSIDTDEMQLDHQTHSRPDQTPKEEEEEEEDNDIVLVDADGATEEERKIIDESGLNLGSGTADGSAR